MMKAELSGPKALLRQLPQGSRCLCAVSGGLDSMCLLHLLAFWGRTQGLWVAAAHFHHGLRGAEADRDEAFVREICARWEVPFAAGRGDARAAARREGLSLEEAGRNLRYAFLDRTAGELDCTVVLTAHHADDQAETMLFNLIRGSGVRGLAGMPVSQGRTLRIFLKTPRAELAAYAAAHGITYVEDSTNADAAAASRNFLRLRVMPLLREVNTAAPEHLAAAAERLRQVDVWIEEEARRWAGSAVREGDRITLAAAPDRWKEIPRPVRPRLILLLLEQLGAGRKNVDAAQLETLDALACRGRGSVDFPGGFRGCCGDGCVVIERTPRPETRAELLPSVAVRWGAYTLTRLTGAEAEGIALRADAADRVEVGPCPPGARLFLPEASGARTVKRLCLDRRIPLECRDNLPALYVNGVLAAVWKLGTDRRFSPAEKETDCLIQIIHNKEE